LTLCCTFKKNLLYFQHKEAERVLGQDGLAVEREPDDSAHAQNKKDAPKNAEQHQRAVVVNVLANVECVLHHEIVLPAVMSHCGASTNTQNMKLLNKVPVNLEFGQDLVMDSKIAALCPRGTAGWQRNQPPTQLECKRKCAAAYDQAPDWP
jgi:hypothetical protein